VNWPIVDGQWAPVGPDGRPVIAAPVTDTVLPDPSPSAAAPVAPATPTAKHGLFGNKARAEAAQAAAEAAKSEAATLRAELTALGGLDLEQIQDMIAERRRELAQVEADVSAARSQLAHIRAEVVETNDIAVLQQVGVYDYSHPLKDAVAFKEELAEVMTRIKEAARGGTAIAADTNWQVNGSVVKGRAMVGNYSKLMLRAYNAEADNCIRTVKHGTVARAVDRLTKTRETIAKLGKTMSIRVTDHYHQLRVEEIRLTGDYLVAVEAEKERVREERERRREDEIVRREIERERLRLLKEQQHYRNALARLGDDQTAAEPGLLEKLAEIDNALTGVDEREANIRLGYVYVISNLGSFGEHIVKIGMTRRMDPMDRVRELGDASVPFKFDVHALIFSKDAVALEAHLHRELEDRRVNLVNRRREFFYVTPAEVRAVVERVAGELLLEYTIEPEAFEWRQSGSGARGASEVTLAAPYPSGSTSSSASDSRVVTP
jgi:hypothetical protein